MSKYRYNYGSKSYYATDEWFELRRKTLERDNKTCKDCGFIGKINNGIYGNPLVAHHIIPRSMGGKDELNNLETPCRKCHGKQPKNKRDRNE